MAPFRPPRTSSPSYSPPIGGSTSKLDGKSGTKSLSQRKLEKLKQEEKELLKALGGEDPNEIIEHHNELLRRYAKHKSATEEIVARLAEIEHVSTREIRMRLGIEADE